jgi:hypothetical protein
MAIVESCTVSRGLGYTKRSLSQRGKLSVSADEWLDHSVVYGEAGFYGGLGDSEYVSTVRVIQG